MKDVPLDFKLNLSFFLWFKMLIVCYYSLMIAAQILMYG